MNGLQYIDTPEALARALEAVGRSSWAALDTEADSLHHYTEKICLLQVSVADDDFVIDPLVSLDLKPLVHELSQKSLILHGADFDIRMMKKIGDFHPKEIFDTMIAAQLLGYDGQGLADLALRHCGVALNKASQKTDWSRRPLDERHIIYAGNDTHYLKQIRDCMERELVAAGRIAWHCESCARLLTTLAQPRTEETGREHPWQIKGSRVLKGRALTILRELWVWREEEARRRDRPVFKVLNSEYLIGIAQWSEKHPGRDIRDWAEAPRNVKGEHRDMINELIKKAWLLPETRFIQERKKQVKKRWGNAETERLKVLKAERDRMGSELKIQPSLLGTNAILEILAEMGPRDRVELERLSCLMPWQIDVAGENFLKAINPNPSKTS